MLPLARSGVARNRKTLAHSRKATSAGSGYLILARPMCPRVSKRPSPVFFYRVTGRGRAFRGARVTPRCRWFC